MATLAPPDGSHTSITVSGRCYSCSANGTVDAPDFDAFVLRANGWTDAYASSADLASVSSTASQAAATASSAAAAIPSPSNMPPPSVGVGSASGTSGPYARADHTHATSVQRAIASTSSNGSVTWTFARPYANGQVPTCQATPEQPEGSAFFYVAQVVAGSVTNTQAQFQVLKFSAQVVPALGSTLFCNASAGVTLHMQAALPTQ